MLQDEDVSPTSPADDVVAADPVEPAAKSQRREARIAFCFIELKLNKLSNVFLCRVVVHSLHLFSTEWWSTLLALFQQSGGPLF